MSMVVKAEIAESLKLIEGVFKLRLKMPEDYEQPNPGQFVNVYLNDSSRLLPRPFAVCDWEKPFLTLAYRVVGEGTRILSGCAAGEWLRVSTPLGNGYWLDAAKDYVLVGGSLGAAPLLYAAKVIHNMADASATAVLGFSDETFLVEEFPCPVHIATDGGSAGFHGNAVELLRQTELPKGAGLLACGPKPMLKALAGFARERGLALQVSLDERMGCGYGACVGCVCETKSGHKKVCEDGPVFDASEVVL
jgi:dihydroorotate dehydrogenase electron transfer subunit